MCQGNIPSQTVTTTTIIITIPISCTLRGPLLSRQTGTPVLAHALLTNSFGPITREARSLHEWKLGGSLDLISLLPLQGIWGICRGM